MIRHIRQPGFTIVELLVVMTIITLLISMLLPSLKASRELAQAAVCSGSERQVAIAINAYTVDNATKYPWGTWRPGYGITADNPVTTYDTLVDAYMGGTGWNPNDSATWGNGNPNVLKVLVCPSDPRPIKYGNIATRTYCMTAAISGGVCSTADTEPPASAYLLSPSKWIRSSPLPVPSCLSKRPIIQAPAADDRVAADTSCLRNNPAP